MGGCSVLFFFGCGLLNATLFCVFAKVALKLRFVFCFLFRMRATPLFPPLPIIRSLSHLQASYSIFFLSILCGVFILFFPHSCKAHTHFFFLCLIYRSVLYPLFPHSSSDFHTSTLLFLFYCSFMHTHTLTHRFCVFAPHPPSLFQFLSVRILFLFPREKPICVCECGCVKK